MAVVLEIETSEPFDCRGWEQPTCDQAQIDRQLDEMHRLGVRSIAAAQQVRQPADRRALRQRRGGLLINAGNRPSAGLVLGREDVHGHAAPTTTIVQPSRSRRGARRSCSPALGVPSGDAARLSARRRTATRAG